MKNPENKNKKVENRADGNLGRCNRYRLNDASFSIYLLGERKEADKARNLTLPRGSFRCAIEAAADASQHSAHMDWPTRQAQTHNVPVVPSHDGRRYWFGIARGLREAKQLMIDLGDDSRSRFGWPIYWTRWRAFIFDDQNGVPCHDLPKSRGTSPDYTSMSVADARTLAEKDFSRYDHIGEVADLPIWGAEVLANKDPGLPPHPDFDAADLSAHASYAGGAGEPISPGQCTNNYAVNALARKLRYARDGTLNKPPALQAKAVPESPIHRWLIDTGCGYDLVGRREVAKLQALFRKANIPITFQTAAGLTPGTECLELQIEELGEIIEPYVMASTPAVLSVGRRCQEHGYSFTWVANKRPCFIAPGGYVLTMLQVDGNIPYLDRGTASTDLTDANVDQVDETLAEAGLCRWNGKLALDLDVDLPESATPVVHFCEETAAGMGMTREEILESAGEATEELSLDVGVGLGLDACSTDSGNRAAVGPESSNSKMDTPGLAGCPESSGAVGLKEGSTETDSGNRAAVSREPGMKVDGVASPPVVEFPRPPRQEKRQETKWRSKHSKCLTCAPIPGREPGTCRWFGEYNDSKDGAASGGELLRERANPRVDESAIGAPAAEDDPVPPGDSAASDNCVAGGSAASDNRVASGSDSPLADADEEQPGKMTKAEEAHTDVHMRTHKPFNEYCDVCVRAKSWKKGPTKTLFSGT